MSTPGLPFDDIASEAVKWAFRLQVDSSRQCLEEWLEWMGRSQRHALEFMIARTILGALSRPHVSRRPSRRQVIAAVAVLAVAGTALGGFLARRATHPLELAADAVRRSADTDEQFSLPDRTRAHLDVHSEIAVDYSRIERRVQLVSGGALYVVQHDAARPFVAVSGNSVTWSVGTTFANVRSDSGTTVSVVEGRVDVEQICDQESMTMLGRVGQFIRRAFGQMPRSSVWVELQAGEAVTVPATCVGKPPQQRKLTIPELGKALEWTHEYLSFDAVPLSVAVERFNAFNNRRMVVRDPVIGRRLVGGYFWAADPNSFLKALETSFGVRVIRSDVIYLEGADCDWRGDHCERVQARPKSQ